MPGIALCLGIALTARLLQALEERTLGHPYLDGLVLAILLGMGVRTAWEPGELWRPGIRLSAGRLLEVAVALLGASLDLRSVLAAGPGLLLGIAGVVASAMVASYGVGRAAGLPRRMALLVASGNAVCGNSAIAAVAPIIGATAREVASAIAFTAVLGVAVVLALPLLIPALGLSATQYGVLAGLTVYAVPQVLAATAPLGSAEHAGGDPGEAGAGADAGAARPAAVPRDAPVGSGEGRQAPRPPAPGRGRLGRFVPWFIGGFLLLAALNSLGLLPGAVLGPLRLGCRGADRARHGGTGARGGRAGARACRGAGQRRGCRLLADPDRHQSRSHPPPGHGLRASVACARAARGRARPAGFAARPASRTGQAPQASSAARGFYGAGHAV